MNNFELGALTALKKAEERNELIARYAAYSDFKTGVEIKSPEAVMAARNARLWRECAEEIASGLKEANPNVQRRQIIR
jgi:hypothetical protein